MRSLAAGRSVGVMGVSVPSWTALLCFQHHVPLYLGFVGAVSLARNTHEKPLIRRRLDRRRSRLRAVQAALCREHLGGK